ALGEYPDAKKILEAQAMKRMQETKGVRQTDKAPSPTNISSKTNHEFPKRKASDVFSQVMKQEGFRKLLSSRDNEMHELKKMVAEMRELSRKQKEPMNEALEEKCRSMENKIAGKDLALKQAKRRINQLETYVRIRAYNAKFQRHNVPASDPIVQPPKVVRQSSSIPNGVPRARKLSGNLPVFNGHNSQDHENSRKDRQSSLERESSIPDHIGYNHFVNRHETKNGSCTSERHNDHANGSPHHYRNGGQHLTNGSRRKEHQYLKSSTKSHDDPFQHHTHQHGMSSTENEKTFCTTSNFIVQSPPKCTQSHISADDAIPCTSILPPHQRVLKSHNSFDYPSFRTLDLTASPRLKSWSSADSLIPRHSISTRIISKDNIPKDSTGHPWIDTEKPKSDVPHSTEISKVNDIVFNSGTHISTATFTVGAPRVKSEISDEDSFDKDCVQMSSNKKLRSYITNIKFSRGKTVKSDRTEIQNGDPNMKSSPMGSPRPLLKFCKRNSEETIDSGISDKDDVNEEELIRLMELISKDQSLDSINTSLSENDSDLDSDADFE
ncbi:hypothetical protein LOTGIDRAFT_173613, partial [Lottia gigantea]